MVLAPRSRSAVLLFALLSISATVASAQRITATWQGQKLGAVLDRLADTVKQSIWLDRRVDPQQLVTAQFTDMPLEHALADLAARYELGVAQIGEVTYIGPAKTAAELATLAQRARAGVRRTPRAQQKRWLRAAAGSWPRLSEPRGLLMSLAQQAQVTLADDELVPHDLWPARQLPPLALVDRMVLLLAGFDLTCEISPDGKTCRIVPIDYSLPAIPMVQPSRRQAPSQRTGGQKQLFTLQLANKPVGPVLDQLAKQLKLELVWDEASLAAKQLSRETLVSCDVASVDLDDLLQGVLEPAGMAFSRKEQRVEIHAAP